MSRATKAAAIGASFQRALARAAAWVDRRGPWIASALLISVGLVGGLKAVYKPLWFDEIITALIARLPNAWDVWTISKSGADGLPPAYDYAMRASVHLLGNDALGIRLPSLAGYLIFCASLYWVVSRRTSGLYGLFALLLPITGGSWYYATEGRPYGLILGSTGIAACCWQAIAMDKGRKPALAGLTLALFCAFSIHFYSPLLFVPFAVAEFVRTRILRRVDLSVWMALLAPFLVLIPYASVIRDTKLHTGTTSVWFMSPAWFGSLVKTTNDFLGPSLPALIALALIFSFFEFVALRYSWHEQRERHLEHEFAPDLALAASFTLLPVLGVALSKWITHLFFPRYVIASMFGFAMFVSLSIWLIFSRKLAPVLIAVVLLCGLVGHTLMGDIRQARYERTNPVRERMRARIPDSITTEQLPIAIAGAWDFMEMWYYSDPALRRRLYYLNSAESAARWIGFTNLEQIFLASAPYFGTQVIDYHLFVKDHENFYVFGGPDWLVPQLLADHANMVLLHELPLRAATDRPDSLFRIHFNTR